MSISLLRGLLIALVACLLSLTESIAQDSPDVLTVVESIDDQIAELDRQHAELKNEILDSRRRASDLDLQWQSLAGELERLQSRQQELEKLLKEKQQATAEADKDKDAGTKTDQEADEATDPEAETETAEEREQAIAEIEAELVALKPKFKPLTAAVAAAKEVSESAHREIEAVETQTAKIVDQRRQHGQRIESLLRDADHWVSFSDQIAPIFHQRCVACHNARNSQGRYNMANFAAVRAEGESGVAVEPGQADDSLLWQLVHDGSMPYDTDPLDESQVELIRRWIELGARLDSAADPDAPLIRIMPRVKQPEPPDHYHVPVPLTALAIAPSGTWLASSGYHEVLLWSFPEGELIGRISNLAERAHGLAVDPSGSFLAVASGTPGKLGEVKLFDRRSGELVNDLLVSEDSMFDVAWSPDGSRLAACGADGSIAIFTFAQDSMETSEPVRLIEDHADWVHSVAWSPDGQRIVSTSRDKTAKVFDARSGKRLITFGGHNQNVTEAAFLADGQRVVSGGDDKKLRIWNVADAKQLRDIGGFSSELAGLRVLQNDHILTVSNDGRYQRHSSEDGKSIAQQSIASDWVSAIAVTTDETMLAIGDHAGQIHRIEITAKPTDNDSASDRQWLAVPSPIKPVNQDARSIDD